MIVFEFDGVCITADGTAPYPVWPFWNLNRQPIPQQREPTEQDKAVHRAIGLPSSDAKRYGHGPVRGDE